MKKILPILFLVVISSIVQANQDSDSIKHKNKPVPFLDTNYVARYKDRLVVSLYQSYRHYNFDFWQTGITDTLGLSRMNYKTHSNHSTGFGIDYDKISFSLGWKSPVDEKDEKTKGITKTFNLAFSLNGKRHRIETSIRSFQGFYDDDLIKYGLPINDSSIHYQDPSMHLQEYRGKFFWFFNKKKRFSYAAAYSNTQRQLKSAGTLLLISNVYGFRIQSDTGMVPWPATPLFGMDANINGFRSIGISLNPGFSYNLVLFKRLFANATFSWGPELQFRKISHKDGIEKTSIDLGLSALDYRGSIGYNGKYFYIYWFIMGDVNAFDPQNLSMVKSMIYQGGIFGYRFKFENKFTKWLQANKIYSWI